MARRSLDRALGVSGALVLSLTLAGAALATTLHAAVPAAKTASAKADSVKNHGTAKPVATSVKTPAPATAKPVPKTNTPAGTSAKTPTPAAASAKTPAVATSSAKTPTPATTQAASKGAAAMKLPPPSRLATMPTSAPTRATAMPHPEQLRAALARKPAPAKAPPTNVAQFSPVNVTAKAAGPRGAVTLSPAKPGAPVPMGIPAGNAKLAKGPNAPKSSDARAVAAAATGIPLAVAAKGLTAPGPQVSKMTPVETGKPGSPKGGSVTQLPNQAPGRTPTATVGKSTVVPAPPALEDQVTYQYNALGRRDPFNSLLEGAFVGDDEGGDAPPDLGGLKVVGIMWGSNDQFAMVEDVKGNSYVLRRGDKVMNGIVEGLKPDAMIVNITVDGQSQSVTVPITRKGEKNANR